MFPTPAIVLLFFYHTHITICGNTSGARADCTKSYTVCSPKGASTTNEPAVGSALSSVFVDIVHTVNENKNQRRDKYRDGNELRVRASGGSLCCVDGTQCLLLQGYSLPFCYDNYTTNYYLPGGSHGQIASGDYTSSDGSTANLISGNYTLADGTPDNIYGSPSSPSKPDTATLSLPTQYTASGSESAIPATALGEELVYTTTFHGTTIPSSIVLKATAILTVANGSTVSIFTTEAASTVPGTTIGPRTSTITTRIAGASATAKGAANKMYPSNAFMNGAAFRGLILIPVFL
ncbi:hypothetical protein N7G274_004975 [Stereocaulon virgatum]|uniref:Uncharacterized protein n=1 Tax=Stereocaulon virgatum TaxID=373712 RepID=A0ABR4AD71_9LECA